jgi:hypothetical protein
MATMSDRMTLRPWQHAALAAFSARQGPDFLAVATPGRIAVRTPLNRPMGSQVTHSLALAKPL